MLSAVPTLGWDDNLFRLALAAALGGAIGFERELRDREAGLRTHMLVCLGSALFTIVSAYGFHEFLVGGDQVVRADPTRIAAQIVTGIGFLGAGAIIRQGVSVRGLTTAATLWVAAAIGMACGAGYYSGAVLGTDRHDASRSGRFASSRTASSRRSGREERSIVVELRPETKMSQLLDVLEQRAREDRALPARGRARPAHRDAHARHALREAGRDDRRSRLRARRQLGRVAKLCSRNEGKLRELRAALPDWDIELLDRDDYPPEDGDTYYDNARAKARFGRAVGERGAWMLGEDSGLEVDGLEGRPGVHSARFGGDDPVGRLLAELADVGGDGRGARYVCELVALAPDGEEVRGTGVLEPGASTASRAGARASATTRSSSPKARSERSPSSGTSGSGRTPTAPAPRRPCAPSHRALSLVGGSSTGAPAL